MNVEYVLDRHGIWLNNENQLMTEIQKLFSGKWHITEMDKWDRIAINLVSQATINFEDDDMGSFHFIAVHGFMDCRYLQHEGQPLVEFSWQGNDERDDACGRGSAVIRKDGSMTGHIYFHCGEDSSFKADRHAH